MTAGDIYTIVGDGTYGYTSDGVSAASTELENPTGVVVDSEGDLLISEYLEDDDPNFGDAVVDVPSTTITRYGIAMTADQSYTVSGGGSILDQATPYLCNGAAVGPQDRQNESVPIQPAISSFRRLRMERSAKFQPPREPITDNP